MCNGHGDTTTNDAADECRGVDARETADERGADYRPDGTVLERQLPEALRTAFGRFVGRESIDTLGEWARAARRLAGGGSLDVDQLCHTAEETDHWGDVRGERYYFRCFYDAVVLAALADEPVDVHTTSPGGTVVETRAVGTDALSVTPVDAVFSLGIASGAHERSDGDPTLQDGYAAICPYVRAFPDRDAYETWAGDVPAATVAMPLAEATPVARALAAPA